MLGRRWRRTSILTVGLFAFLIGLAAAGFGVVLHESYLMLALIVSLATIARMRTLGALSIVLLGLVLGCLRGQSFDQRLQPLRDNYDEKVVLQVRAASDGVYTDKAQLGFDANHLEFIEPDNSGVVPGRLLVEGYGAKGVFRGDVVVVEGKLRQIRGSRQGVVGFAELEVVGRDDSRLEQTRRGFVAGLSSSLSEPHASFAAGLLIGQRTTIPDNLKKQLSAAGLTHVIAVSGYNLTIIVGGAMWLMRGRSKFVTVATVVAVVGLFLLVTGFSASIVRASIVCGLSLWAWYYGRGFRPWLLIGLAAAITAGVYPLYIWTDLGWYLSFLAFAGILVLAPQVVARLFRSRQPKFIELILIETLCAQVLTLPLILYIYNEVSLISVVANMVVVPLVPLAMLCSAVAGVAGMALPQFAGWLAWPAQVLLTYMLDLVNVMSRPPGVLVHRTLSVVGMMWLYVCIAIVIWVLTVKNRSKHATLTDIDIFNSGK
jgi:competence protein ComEC